MSYPKKLRDALVAFKQGAAMRLDGWVNEATGFGTSRDKTEYGFALPSRILTDIELGSLYHADDMAARMVDVVPQEMLREGFAFESGEPEIDGALNAKFDNLEAPSKIMDGIRWGRCYGGAALLIGADDGRDALEPLIAEQAEDLSYLYVIDRRMLWPLSYYDEPGHPKMGQPKTYLVSIMGGTFFSSTVVHESRLILFRGANTGIRERIQLAGWDLSVLQRVYDVLRSFNTGWKSVETLLVDGNQAIFKMTGLAEMLSSGGEEVLRTRMGAMELYRSVMRAIVIDADGKETFERNSANFANIPDVLDKFMLRLAAAVQIPVTVLMGQSPAGMNATGDSDFRWFYDRIKAEQTSSLAPKIKRLANIWLKTEVGRQYSRGKEDEKIEVTFPALWTETPLVQEQRKSAIASRDATYIQAQVYSPEEVALIRCTPGGFDREIILTPDGIKAREMVLSLDLEKMMTPPLPVDAMGNPIPLDENGNPIPQVDEQGNPLPPPVDEQGNPIQGAPGGAPPGAPGGPPGAAGAPEGGKPNGIGGSAPTGAQSPGGPPVKPEAVDPDNDPKEDLDEEEEDDLDDEEDTEEDGSEIDDEDEEDLDDEEDMAVEAADDDEPVTEGETPEEKKKRAQALKRLASTRVDVPAERKDADWDEDLHPRAADGKFGSGGGSAKGPTKGGGNKPSSKTGSTGGKGGGTKPAKDKHPTVMMPARPATPEMSAKQEDKPKAGKSKDTVEMKAGAQPTKVTEDPFGKPPPSTDPEHYNPDPTIDKHGDGITDASRVGIPGTERVTEPGQRLKPGDVKVPRLANLTPEEREVEERFAAQFERDPQGMVDKYTADVYASKNVDDRTTFGTDNAKVLSTDYSANIENKALYNIATHQTANMIAKAAFEQHMADKVAKLPPEDRKVLVTAGGCAAGKGFALQNAPTTELKSAQSQAAAIWDTAGEQNSTELPWVQKQTEDVGATALYVFVDADPKVAFDRVISRANGSPAIPPTPENPKGEKAKEPQGRTVDGLLFAESYAIGSRNFAAFATLHANNPNLHIAVIDVRTPPPKVVESVSKEAATVTVAEARAAAMGYLEKNKNRLSSYIMTGATRSQKIWAAGKAQGTSASAP